MKAKTKKILTIALVVVISLLVVACVVCYFVIPTQFKDAIAIAWDWLNQPLPIVGISTIMVLFFAFKVFASSSFGKKQIKKINEEFARVKQESESSKQELETFKQNLLDMFKEFTKDKDSEIEKLKEFNQELCKLLPNKKVKELGEKVYGKETDSSTETKGL